jgi:hypothetical protein
MPGGEKARRTAGAADWPNHLREKHGRLAIPAVVAAVLAEKGKLQSPVEKPERRRDKAAAKDIR